MSTDVPLEQRLHAIYAVTIPVALDRRVATAIAAVPQRRSSLFGRRRIAVLAVAAVLATVAAAPVANWFADWDPYHDRLWELSVPVEQTATHDGYRVTVQRAYADALGVRLAMSVVDLEDRWSQLQIDAADVTDSDGRAYEGWNWSRSEAPANSTDARWARFILPGDAPEDLGLRVTVTAIAVRAPEPLELPLDPERIWTSVAGEWTFDVDVPVTAGGHTIEPGVSVSKGGVTVTWEELELVPSGPVARLTVRGLPELPAGSAEGWFPILGAEHDGQGLTDDVFPYGVFSDGDAMTVEIIPYLDVPVIGGFQVADDLTGRWKITIDGFYSSFDPTREGFGKGLGPWVLEVDVPAGS